LARLGALSFEQVKFVWVRAKVSGTAPMRGPITVEPGTFGALRELNRLRVVDAPRRAGTGSRSDFARMTRPFAHAVATRGDGLTLHEVLALVADGCLAARRVVADAGRAVGRAVADLCNCLNPAAIIVGGDLSLAGDPLLAGVREEIDRHALPGAAEAVEVKAGVLGERAEMLGALAVVIADTDRLRTAGLAPVAAG
jgi:hypothetical protein